MYRRKLIGLLSVALMTGATWVAATPASAVGGGCAYPRVCFYLTYDDFYNDRPTASFQDVTSGWQNLGPRSFGADWIVNTRNDDVAYLHFTDGSTWCMTPRETDQWTTKTVDKIRISWSSTC